MQEIKVVDFVDKRINDIGDALQALGYPEMRELAKKTGICTEVIRRLRSPVSRKKWSFSLQTVVLLDDWYLAQR